jgi:hypothetical protein
MKRCTKCGEEQPLSAYGPKEAQCKLCRKAQRRAWRVRNKDRDYRNILAWRARNKDRVCAANTKSYLNNRDSRCAAQRQRYPAYKPRQRENQRTAIRDLSDGYVRQLLAKSMGIEAQHLPGDLVEAHRARLQLQRELKKGTAK